MQRTGNRQSAGASVHTKIRIARRVEFASAEKGNSCCQTSVVCVEELARRRPGASTRARTRSHSLAKVARRTGATAKEIRGASAIDGRAELQKQSAPAL